jgi:hypothetical protein
MKHFFPMDKQEALVLVYLIGIAVISFLPIWRTIEIGGMAVFGWLMVLLMITSPLLTLLVFRRTDRTRAGNNQHNTTGIKDIKSETRSTDSESEV